MKFTDFPLSSDTLRALADMGYDTPTPVQERVLQRGPSSDCDLIALAQTGTGKTIAYGLVLLARLTGDDIAPEALVLTPTRELCLQVAEELKRLSQYHPVDVLPLYGGEDIRRQIRALSASPRVVVATPGRLLDLVRRAKISLQGIRTLVLDEADEMLNMGFQPDLESIVSFLPSSRTTLMFSATLPPSVERLSSAYLRPSYDSIVLGERGRAADTVRHEAYLLPRPSLRYETVRRLIDSTPQMYAIVFCKTRSDVKSVSDLLIRDGYQADALHGDLTQSTREAVLTKFRVRATSVLVATDVAARGLDVNDLTHVIHYNLPEDAEVYTHRSGRTGRAGKSGVSMSVVTERERRGLVQIERTIHQIIEMKSIPTVKEIREAQVKAWRENLQRDDSDENDWDDWIGLAKEALEGVSREELITRLVKKEFSQLQAYYAEKPEDINITRDTPKVKKRTSKKDRIRFRVSFGKRDGFQPQYLLGVLNTLAGHQQINVGDIEIGYAHTFFDIDKDQAEEVERILGKEKQFKLKRAGETRTTKGEKEKTNKFKAERQRQRNERKKKTR